MIIVAGWARTGTSIMFKCLQESGFYGGPEKVLGGAQYKTEHAQFRVCNFLIMYYAGFQPIATRYQLNQLLVDDFFTDTPDVYKRLPDGVREKMGAFLEHVKENNIEILKDPQAAFAIKEWINFSPVFRSAKYIWCRRDPLKAAKSFVRLKLPRIPQYRGVLTTTKALKTYKLHDKIWGNTLKELDHRVVWLEDLLNKPLETKKIISDFIGRDFNMDLVDKKKTYDGGDRKDLGTVKFNMEDLRPVEFT